jgi:NTP pyrophosphatase (non-canonical NTP hydrolase)
MIPFPFTLKAYQENAKTFDLGGKLAPAIIVHILGLAGEAGEVVEKFKKHLRDGADIATEDISKELGDVLWYISALASDLNLDLEQIARQNILKLQDRKNRNVVSGAGDNR